MILDEAIQHCEEVAKEQEHLCECNDDYNLSQPKWRKCAEEHRQLAEWLKELKQLREQTKWIPVSERLPENAKHKGAFCPKYYVMTEFGQTEGWYNPDFGCWYVLLWFMDARFETWNISLERGDVPKIVKNVPVTAWMPLPEPYKAESEDKE